MNRRLIVLLLFILCVGQKGFAQETSGCLSHIQLTRLQYADLGDLDVFLTSENWRFAGTKTNQTINYFAFPFTFDEARWEKTYSQNNGTLILYGVSDRNRIVLYQTNSRCYAAIKGAFSNAPAKTSIENNLLKTVIQREELTIEFRESTSGSYGNNYTILVYNTRSIERAVEAVLEQQRLEARMEAERKERYLNTIAEADSLYKLGQFSLALQNYELAQQLDPKFSLREKINLSIQGKSQSLNAEADTFLERRQYETALAKFKESANYASKYSFLKSQAEYAQRKIGEIEEIKAVLNIRKNKIFQYSEINPKEYASLKQGILNEVSQLLENNPTGNLNLQYQISFDTLGTNLSKMNSFNSTLANTQSRFSRLVKEVKLKPSQLDEFYVSSEDEVTLKANWNTYSSTYTYNSKGLQPWGGYNTDSEKIKSFLKENSYAPGKYTVSVIEKNINDRPYRDIKLTNYNTVGPEAAFLSLLMPGMGTLTVTHGEKGWERVRSFLLFTGLSIAAQSFSNSQYAKYEAATLQEDMDSYFAAANLSHKVSLASAGIAASIYIHDFIWVISKGLKNKKQANGIQSQLKLGGVSIQNQPIQW